MTDVASPKSHPRSMGKIIFFVIILIAVVALIWSEKARRYAVHQLQQTTAQVEELKKSTDNSPQEISKRVLENVAKLIHISVDPVPTVATISDVTKLQESNGFFKAATNGNFLILTQNRAILYDLDKNIILDVAPFQATPNSTPVPSISPTPKPKVSP